MLKNKGFKVHNRTAYWSALCSLNITEVFTDFFNSYFTLDVYFENKFCVDISSFSFKGKKQRKIITTKLKKKIQ